MLHYTLHPVRVLPGIAPHGSLLRDGFKAVNDTAGLDAGDAVLVEVARRLSAAVRAEDLVARLGGDEFAVLRPGTADSTDASVLAERILRDLSAPIAHRGALYQVGASIGIALADRPEPGADGVPSDARQQRLVAAADAAMYQAKRLGRGRWVLAGGQPDRLAAARTLASEGSPR